MYLFFLTKIEEYQSGGQTTFPGRSPCSSSYSELVQAQSGNWEPHHDLRKRKPVLSYLPWFSLRNLWESTVLKSELVFRATVLCHLWNNNVLFNTENLIHPGDEMGPNPHLMSISVIPLPLARLQCVRWSNTNLLLLRALAFCLIAQRN